MNAHYAILTAQQKQSGLGEELPGLLLDGHHNFVGKLGNTCGEGLGVVGDMAQVMGRQTNSVQPIRPEIASSGASG